MADINVERKGPSIWPWIIGLIVLALLIWALTQMFRDDTRVAPGTPTDTVRVDTPVAPGFGVDTPTTQTGIPPTTGPGAVTDTPIGGAPPP